MVALERSRDMVITVSDETIGFAERQSLESRSRPLDSLLDRLGILKVADAEELEDALGDLPLGGVLRVVFDGAESRIARVREDVAWCECCGEKAWEFALMPSP
jgi:hypothetical protein